MARLTTAIATGGDMPSLVAGLGERERRRAQARGHLADIERRAARKAVTPARVLAVARERIAKWRETIHEETPHARQALRALLAGRRVVTP